MTSPLVESHPDVQSFLARVQAPLEENEAENNLLLGSVMALPARPSPGDVELITVDADDQLVIAAAMTPPRPVMLARGPGSSGGALEVLVESLAGRGASVAGVVAPLEVADAFAALWCHRTGHSFRLAMRQRAHSLVEIQGEPLPSTGTLRVATPDDLELVAEWAGAFQREAIPSEDGSRGHRIAEHRIGAGEVYLWESGGEPVSMAGKARPTRRGICVNLVYTPPEMRRRGFASQCVTELTRTLLEDREFCMLFTDLSNPTSNHIYRKIGYTPVRDFAHHVFWFESETGSS